MTLVLIMSFVIWIIALVGSTMLLVRTRDERFPRPGLWAVILLTGLMVLRSVLLLARNDRSIDGGAPPLEWMSLAGGCIALFAIGQFIRRQPVSPPDATEHPTPTPTDSAMAEAIADGPSLTWVLDRELNTVRFNSAWLAFRGRTLEEELRNGWTHGVHIADLPTVQQVSHAAREAHEPFEVECRLNDATGTHRWILVSALPHMDPDGAFAGYIGSCLPLSERRAAEVSLLRAHAETETRIRQRTAELARQNQRQAAINQIESAINQRLELVQLLEAVVRSVADWLPATAGASVVLWDEQDEAFTTGFSTHDGQDDRTIQIPTSDDAARRIVEHGEPLIVRDLHNESPDDNRMLLERDVAAYVGVPLFDADRVIGILWALDNQPRDYAPRDIDFIQTLANRATLAIVRTRLHSDLQSANEQLEQRVEDRTQALNEANATLEREIEDRRQAEKKLVDSETRYRSLVENATEAIVVCDAATGCFIEANGNAARFFKLDRKALLETGPVGLSPTRQPNGQLSSAAFLDRVESVMNDEPAIFDWIHRNAEGEDCPCEVRLLRLPSEDRLLVRGVIIDISRRKEVEEQQRELERQLRQTERLEAAATLAAGVAHDVNNSLTAILGYTAIARKSLDDPQHVAQSLDGIDRTSSQTAAIARSLLTFSRRNEGRRAAIDVGVILLEEIPTVQILMPDSVELVVHAQPSVAWIEGNDTQIRQIILNLALNARDALPDGGHITFEVHTTEDTVALAVTDDGIGMSSDVQEQIYDPFFSTKPRERGTGLGMTIVHSIVNDHDGEIEIDSKQNRGTTVRITLPSSISGPSPTPTITNGQMRKGNGQRIFIADDNGQVRSVMAQWLTSAQYDVRTAGNGADALEQLEECNFDIDLIILDIDMPRINGIETLHRIRDDHPEMPAIFISGLSDQNMHTCAEMENVTVLQKPFQVSELTNAIAEMLDAHQNTPGVFHD